MSKFYRYWSEVGPLEEIEEFIKINDNNFYVGEPVEFSISENTDVFYIKDIGDNEAIQLFQEEDLDNNDISKLLYICDKRFWTFNNKEYAIIYNNTDNLNSHALLIAVRKISLCDYKQIFVKIFDEKYKVWRTVEF